MNNPALSRKPSRGLMGFPSEPQEHPQTVWAEALADDDGGRRTLYLHIPFCRSRCSFCLFYSGSATDSERAGYVRLLAKELNDWSERLPPSPINAVYFGGGTPSDLAPQEMELLLGILRSRYPLANDCEITLESRLNGLTDRKIDAAIANGVNRFSLGVQTFDTELRRRLGRVSDRETVLDTLGRLVARNQASVAVDLLYGLPGQTPELLLADLETLLTSGVSGLSFYRLNVRPTSELAGQLAAGTMPPVPPDETIYRLYELAEERLEAAGVKRLSFKHFSFDPRERNLFNEISAWKVPCLPFGFKARGRLGAYQFRQTVDMAVYRSCVETGAKPVERAGKLPPDYPVAFRLTGQLNSRMTADPAFIAAAAPPELRETVRRVLCEQLSELEREGLTAATAYGGWKLTRMGRFRFYPVATRLLEEIAKCWEMESK